MKQFKALAIALVVGLAAECIDLIFHFLLGAEVHLPYLAIKVTVIAFTFFFVTYWIGVSHRDGIAGAAIASLLFYVYYRFAEPTLDRTLFKLDEDTLFILIHFLAIWFVYWLTWRFIMNELVATGRRLTTRALAIVAVVSTIIGVLFLLPTGEFLKTNNLMLGLSLNDHVLIGTLGFTLAVIGVYNLIIKFKKIKIS